MAGATAESKPPTVGVVADERAVLVKNVSRADAIPPPASATRNAAKLPALCGKVTLPAAPA